MRGRTRSLSRHCNIIAQSSAQIARAQDEYGLYNCLIVLHQVMPGIPCASESKTAFKRSESSFLQTKLLVGCTRTSISISLPPCMLRRYCTRSSGTKRRSASRSCTSIAPMLCQNMRPFDNLRRHFRDTKPRLASLALADSQAQAVTDSLILCKTPGRFVDMTKATSWNASASPSSRTTP